MHQFHPNEIPIYQDTEQLGLWNNVFGGRKDDFFIFDRCGRRVYHIPLPYSNLRLNYTRYAINMVYNRRDICGDCNQPSNFMDRMMGDQPATIDIHEPRSSSRRRHRHGGHHQDRDM